MGSASSRRIDDIGNNTQFLLCSYFSSVILYCKAITKVTTPNSLKRGVGGALCGKFYGNVDNYSLLELYSVLVRPHLEYAAPIWDPHFIKDTNKLESVQKFALKMCLKQWDLGYQDLLDLSQFPTLENRRLYLKLCTLYKIIHSYFYFPTANVFVAQLSK